MSDLLFLQKALGFGFLSKYLILTDVRSNSIHVCLYFFRLKLFALLLQSFFRPNFKRKTMITQFYREYQELGQA